MSRDILKKVFKEDFLEWEDVRPGAVENDTFVINDVALRISPSQINIEKTSYNKEWVTLRTKYPRKAKSGYGTLRISLALEFKLSNWEDRDNLSRLVAGLRATPFCVVYNHYLERMVGNPAEFKAQEMGERNDDEYNPYQPIMLALSTMNFSTGGHEGKPDCVIGTFDFLWFNYLPYTNFISFKSGMEYDQPGFPWQSTLWKLFYEPYLNKQVIPTYPHVAALTTFMWREYFLLPIGDPAVLQASEDIAEAVKNKPQQVAEIFRGILNRQNTGGKYGGYETKATDPSIINDKLLDVLYRDLIRKGVINPSELVKENLEQRDFGVISQTSTSLLEPLLRDLTEASFTGNANTDKVKASANFAASILNQRKKEAWRLQKESGQLNDLGSFGWDEILNTSFESNETEGGKRTSIGGIKLFGRKQKILIDHQNFDVNPSNIIIQINVSFQHNLSILPMLAYNYPTIQHVGGMDAQVDIVFNSTRSGAEEIRQMYDAIENSSIKFKRIPAAYNNLYIDNDFLKIFDLSEFLTSNLQINTIYGQPERNSVQLSLTVAGLQTTDVENIEQEFIISDTELQKSVWKILDKNMSKYEGLSGEYEYDFGTGHYDYGKFGILEGSNFFAIAPLNKKSKINQAIDINYYKLKPEGIGIGIDNSLYKDLIDEAVGVYNKELDYIYGEIFNKWSTTEARKTSYYLFTVQQDGEFGFIPGLEKIKRTLLQIDKERVKNGYDSRVDSNVAEDSVNRNKQQAIANTKIAYYYGDPQNTFDEEPFGMAPQKAAFELRQKSLYDMGIPQYATDIKSLINKIVKNYLPLPQFGNLKDKVVKAGLNTSNPTYMDFMPSLLNVANVIEGRDSSTNSVINQYEPDYYFFYSPGKPESALYGTIDSFYITLAQQYSKLIYDNAETQIGNFFKGIYQNKLNSGTHIGPTSFLAKKELHKPVYENKQISNYTASSEYTKEISLDANIKAPTNWYNVANEQVKSPNVCVHSTNFNDLWGGVPAGSGEISAQTWKDLEPLNKQQSNSVDYFHPDKVGSGQGNLQRISLPPNYQVQQYPTSSFLNFPVLNVTSADKAKLNLIWPSTPRSNTFTSGKLFLAPRDGGSRTHKGIDIANNEGTDIFAVADGVIVKFTNIANRVGGISLRIAHKNGWVTDYMHLMPNSVPPKFQIPKAEVKQKDVIGAIGNTGIHSTGPHLHFQISNKERYADPLKLLPDKALIVKNVQSKFTQSNKRFPTSLTIDNQSPLMQAIREFERDVRLGQAQSLMRAYPAFKLYFIEEDSDEEGKKFSFDDFFNYQAVQSIRVVRNREIAADLCEIYLTNVSGVLTNSKFGPPNIHGSPTDSKNKVIREDSTQAGTKYENPIASLLLQEGMNISLRLGYSNNAENLETVFNGIIMEVEFADADDLIRIVCQSYAVELIQDIKGIEKPKTKTTNGYFGETLFWGIGSKATTGRILEDMLSEPEVLHFGRWHPKSNTKNLNRSLLTDRWTFVPQPQDDNIFAPSINEDISSLDDEAIAFQNLKYVIYRTTIWDIIQEMLLRHPNFVALPVPYSANGQERMTLFFGLPNQLYFARDPNPDENLAQERLKKEEEGFDVNKFVKEVGRGKSYKEYEDLLRKKLNTNEIKIEEKSFDVTSFKLGSERGSQKEGKAEKSIEEVIKGAVGKFIKSKKDKRLESAIDQGAGFIKPFRNYHLITSAQHILSNNVRASAREVANTITVIYGKDAEINEDASGSKVNDVAIEDADEEFTLKLDNALPTEDIRVQMGEFVNVTNESLAKRYALSMLINNMRNIYRGEIVIIGNPKIRPFDVCFIMDTVSDMVGAFEVKEVQHSFDHEGGFITSITPSMLVCAADYALLSSIEAMGIAIEGFFRGTSGNNANIKRENVSTSSMALSLGMQLFGGTLSNKIINFTQLAQPIIMTPLTHHGRPFTGGIPTRKISTSLWNTVFGNWQATSDAAFSEWADEVGEDIINSFKKNLFFFTEGEFFSNV